MSEGVKNSAAIWAVMGSTGAGKSTFIKGGLASRRKPRRLMIWDPMEEYGAFGTVTASAAELVGIVQAAGRAGKFAVVFRPGLDTKAMAGKFELFCKLAFAAGNLTLIVEELKLVTRPAAAPLPWVRCCIQGRHRGLRIIGTSQRPAHIDKDFLGNATMIRCGCLGYREDMRAVASSMLIDPDELAGLKPLEFVAYDKSSREYQRGMTAVPA